MPTRELWKAPHSPGLTAVTELLTWVKHRARAPLLSAREAGGWRTLTARQFYDQVRGLEQAMQATGLQAGERIGLLAESSPEWVLADFACLAAGLVDVPIYPTLTGDQVAYILQNSAARGLFLSTRAQVEKLAPHLARLPELRWVCCFEGETGLRLAVREFSWPAWLATPPREGEAEFDSRMRSTPTGRLATMLYTSGTTGVPKGVPLTHANLCANLNVSTMDFYFAPEERRLSILPLAHITERHMAYVDLLFDCHTWYADKLEAVPQYLAEVRPTFLVAVPRLFEKVAAAVQADLARRPGAARRLFAWAQGVGRRMAPYWQAGWPWPGVAMPRPAGGVAPPPGLRWQAALADRLVWRRLRGRLGGCLNKICVGGAPLGHDLADFFLSLGLVLDEGYGLTETSPVISINRPGARRIGSVGRALPNVEVSFAGDGELLVRGPGVFGGYYNLPDATAEALHDGWFHTGDIGQRDADGFLSVTDRKKDLIKTAGGKFIAPQPIEARLKACAWVAEAVVVGDRRPYAAVLLVPNFPALEAWAGERGISVAGREELCRETRVQALFQAEIDRVNASLARFETLKRFALLPHEFSLAAGELTPTIKVRRRGVEKNYSETIAALYSDSSAAGA